MEQIISALEYIASDDRETWIRVGAALRTELGEEGFTTWDAWSKQAENYDASVMKITWRSFRPGLIHGRTIFYLARQAGWEGLRPHGLRPGSPAVRGHRSDG